MNKIIVGLLLVFTLSNTSNLFSQEDPKELFEKSWGTTDENEKGQLREKIIEVSPDSEYGLFCKGWFLSQKEDYKSSLEFFNKAISINEKFWQAYHTRASLYGLMNEPAKAIADFTSAIAINPNNADSYFVRGATYYYTGEIQKGCDDLLKASSLGLLKAKNLMEKVCK